MLLANPVLTVAALRSAYSSKPSECFADVFGLDWRAAFLRHFEQRTAFPLSLLRSFRVASATVRFLACQVFCLFDFQCFFCDGLHNLKGEEAQDVDDIVIGFRFRDDAEPGPFPESLALSEREAGLSTFAPVQVFVGRHVLGPFVGFFFVHVEVEDLFSAAVGLVDVDKSLRLELDVIRITIEKGRDLLLGCSW